MPSRKLRYPRKWRSRWREAVGAADAVGQTIMAEPAYAVGGLVVSPGGERLGGFQVIFSKITPDRGNPKPTAAK